MNNKLSIVLLSVLAGNTTVSLSATKVANKSENRPNIIFIMTDDHAFQALSAYKHPLSKIAPTPNIDRIAEQGMRFDRCLVTNSISGPSRACILTGKYSHLNGFITNEKTEFDGSQQTFPKLLQQTGYHTAIIGKWHLGSTPTGFDYWDILDGQGEYYNPQFIKPQGQNIETGYVTDIITDKTIALLKSYANSDKPFMVMMHHKAPHRSWEPNIKHLHAFDSVQFPVPESFYDDYSKMGLAAQQQEMTIENDISTIWDLKMLVNPDTTYWSYKSGYGRYTSGQRKAWDEYYNPVIADFIKKKRTGKELTLWKYQRYMNDYLACIRSVDESVGRVLDYLKASGLDKNTMVVYTSDQGFYLGEHGWFDKRFMYEESYRTPLLWYWPGVTKAGVVSNDIVSNLDFAQTFLDAAGAKIPSDMQGESLKPVLKGRTPSDWRKAHYYHYYEYPGIHAVKRHYGISTKRYKLIHFYYDIDEWELYDLKKDPSESRSLYNNPDYENIQKKLHKQLEVLRKKYKDGEAETKKFLPQKQE